MTVRVGIVLFPGSNRDIDAVNGLTVAGADPRILWHEDVDLSDVSGILLPGGFAYGDYIRAGVIARFSPVMRAVADFAARGGPVLGICNGFQVLAEGLDAELLHERVRQELAREPVHDRAGRRLVGRGDRELDPSSDPDTGHAGQAEVRQAAFDRLALRVEDAGLGRDVDREAVRAGRLAHRAITSSWR